MGVELVKNYPYYCHGIDKNWEQIDSPEGDIFETVKDARNWAEDNEFPHYEIILINTDEIVEEA
jgi:hypothetical protein